MGCGSAKKLIHQSNGFRDFLHFISVDQQSISFEKARWAGQNYKVMKGTFFFLINVN
jgi:hypothetical protein